MAFTQADLDAIEELIAEGTTKNKYEDREEVIDGLDGLLRRRDLILRSLGQSKSSGAVTVRVSKGLG